MNKNNRYNEGHVPAVRLGGRAVQEVGERLVVAKELVVDLGRLLGENGTPLVREPDDAPARLDDQSGLLQVRLRPGHSVGDHRLLAAGQLLLPLLVRQPEAVGQGCRHGPQRVVFAVGKDFEQRQHALLVIGNRHDRLHWLCRR